jgi:hypothetical protein
MKRPAGLDLKMGTRTYGDDATPAKVEEQTKKAMESTQGTLGLRVVGARIPPPPGQAGADVLQVYTYIHACMRAYIHAYIVHMHKYVYVCLVFTLYIHVHTHTRIRMTHTHTRMTHTHTHTHTHHVYVGLQVSPRAGQRE